jgi:hypothetical protein
MLFNIQSLLKSTLYRYIPQTQVQNSLKVQVFLVPESQLQFPGLQQK